MNHNITIESLKVKRDRALEQAMFDFYWEFDLLLYIRQVKDINYEYDYKCKELENMSI